MFNIICLPNWYLLHKALQSLYNLTYDFHHQHALHRLFSMTLMYQSNGRGLIMASSPVVPDQVTQTHIYNLHILNILDCHEKCEIGYMTSIQNFRHIWFVFNDAFQLLCFQLPDVLEDNASGLLILPSISAIELVNV